MGQDRSPDRLLTVREAAALLNVKTGTLYAWATQGRVPVQHVNRCLRFPLRELEQWLRTQRRPAGCGAPPPEAA